MNPLATKNTSGPIDRKSYILGMMTAFAECVANECKKLALSPPFYPGDQHRVVSEAKKLAEDQGICLWFEKNLDIPLDQRLNWFVLYKFPEVLDQYRRLRSEGFNPAWHFEKFSDLLSYGTAWGQGAEAVVPGWRDKKDTKDTFARILLKPGEWPIPR
jgi:hypothetical protein